MRPTPGHCRAAHKHTSAQVHRPLVVEPIAQSTLPSCHTQEAVSGRAHMATRARIAPHHAPPINGSVYAAHAEGLVCRAAWAIQANPPMRLHLHPSSMPAARRQTSMGQAQGTRSARNKNVVLGNNLLLGQGGYATTWSEDVGPGYTAQRRGLGLRVNEQCYLPPYTSKAFLPRYSTATVQCAFVTRGLMTRELSSPPGPR